MIRTLLMTTIVFCGIPSLGHQGLVSAAAPSGVGVPFFSWFAPKERVLEPTGQNLYEAALEGKFEQVKDLVARGADVNYERAAALQMAATLGHVDMVKLLLEAGANPNGTNGKIEGESDIFVGDVLRAAVSFNHLDVVNILLDAGATVKLPKYTTAVLDGAARNGNIAILHRLLEAGADPNHGGGYTMLLAAQKGHIDIVKALIEAGGDVNAGDGWIVNNAAEYGHLDIVKLLMESGLNKEDYGDAMTVAASGGHLDIVKLMLENGVDPSYGSVLKSAIESGNIEIVRILLEAGSTIKYDEERGFDLLHYAVIEGKPDIVKLLVDFGADINRALTKDLWFDFTGNTEKYGKGWTVAHVAARWGEPMIKELRALGVDLNLPDDKGNTPLQVALKYEKFFVFRELLKFCADVTPTNKEGKTALDLVLEIKAKNASNSTGYTEVMEILRKVMPEKFVSNPSTLEMQKTLRKEFASLLAANSTLNDTVKDVRSLDIDYAINLILEERNLKGIVNAFENYKCKLSLPDQETVELETEYLAKCKCVLGQGLQMTLTPIQDANVCKNVTADIQEEGKAN